MSDTKKFTSSGIEIPPYLKQYTSKSNGEAPGSYPYTRGIHKDMYRGKPWTMRQYAGFSTARESNIRYKELLAKGAKGLSVAFDLPTQMGYDSDDALAKGEVGKVGVAIDSIEDMRILFNDIDLSTISTSMTINATASILLALYICVAEEKGISSDKISGTIQNDILKEYIARGTYIFPPKASLRIVTDIFEYCSKNVPKWNTISISGYHIREAGSNAVQEVAFTIANAITYVESALSVGLKIDEFAPRLSFFFNVHNNFFEEIAKFRAARRIWAKIVKEKFNAQDEKSLLLRFHSQVAGSTLTAQQPMNNIMRVTLQALAAVLGGTQSLHTNAFDEALQLPTSESAEIALRTQQIIANESHVTDFVDPLGGSYQIEALTDEIEKLTNEYLDIIKSKGGVIACIESGFLQAEILDSAYKAQLDIESKKELVVGVNCLTESEKRKIPANKISKSIEIDQVKRLTEFKKQRDNKSVEAALSKLKLTAKSNDNLMPIIIECIKKNCTVGEIANSLREVFGKYVPKTKI